MIQKLRGIFMIGVAIVMACSLYAPSSLVARASGCPDLKVVFVRGSGAPRWENADYLSFYQSVDEKLARTGLNYEIIDLDYPAVSVGLNNIGVTLGAYIGGGEAYEFGESINAGVTNLVKLSKECPDTKLAIGGYSQGAMVALKSLGDLGPSKVIYVATFGDPKIYLPEGEGIMPAACRGENLSSYRMYVPDCQAYKGLLGAYIPYEPETFAGKVGTWCNKRDIMCSSRFSVSDHTGYDKSGLYEDASRVMVDRITKSFGLDVKVTSSHDTAFLIDATWSMEKLIDDYKEEALRLASETFNSGGRVALFTYHDLDDFSPSLIEHCNFETCTESMFKNELDEIVPMYGGDIPESLLSGSFHLMKTMKWRYGATKSLVVLTDANYVSPDRDGTTLDDVVTLSKSIDPVNFYIITTDEFTDDYTELAERTGGKVETDFNKLSILTDHIMARYDSLPRVEKGSSEPIPVLKVTYSEVDNGEARVKFETDGDETLVVLNDAILGVTNEREITIGGVDFKEDYLTLVPIKEDLRGEPVTVPLITDSYGGVDFVPKVPDAGIPEGCLPILFDNKRLAGA